MPSTNLKDWHWGRFGTAGCSLRGWEGAGLGIGGAENGRGWEWAGLRIGWLFVEFTNVIQMVVELVTITYIILYVHVCRFMENKC